jgi:hypothetical protein
MPVPEDQKRYLSSIEGAEVHFGTGTNMRYVRLESDIVSVRITNLPVNTSLDTLFNLLHPYGIEYFSSIVLYLNDSCLGPSCEVEPNNAYLAESICQALDKTTLKDHETAVQLAEDTDNIQAATVSRLQITSLSCSWPEPSKVAWIYFTLRLEVGKIVAGSIGKHFDGCILESRTQQARIGEGESRVYPVHIRNIASATTTDQSATLCSGKLDVEMGRVSYSNSDEEAFALVKQYLPRAGDVVALDVHE